ncbi:hypothetical protein BV25DRAFT_1906053 [Artomyces pyxidatus]|uniref:Uncharacterized protein n=1 Tax=Artomyces pyxidatus TaxID=48021 RepID=A0ACB8TA30_9AGAM|nr:hypothetical protein BV25DRAFT_1906053 [Artomyces pyxidatus]
MSTPLGSPFKGKAKEEERWQPGWWQLHPLSERPQRPVAWTSSSTILFAHATLPTIVGRVFPSHAQFAVPPPAPITGSPALYEPPTIINVSPNGQWMFAYFPGRDEAGVGCFWTRGIQVDDWNVREWWSFPSAGGAVTSTWLGHPREWINDASGRAIRLPALGPPTPGSTPTLMLITENLQVLVCYVRKGTVSIKIITCSLTFPDEIRESIPSQNPGSPACPEGAKLCVSAAIGLGYDETSIMVATRSRILTGPSSAPSFTPIDLALSLDLNPQTQDEELNRTNDWEKWGEDSSIELCEVRLGFDGVEMNLSTNPLPPLECPYQRLSELVFVTGDPRPPRPADFKDANPVVPHIIMYLVASFVDFDDYSSSPKSQLLVYSMSRKLSPSHRNVPEWSQSPVSSRSFTSEVLAFVTPHHSFLRTSTILAGTINTSMPLRTVKRKTELSIGSVTVLQLPSLNPNAHWEPAPILGSSVDKFLQDFPCNVALSPNGGLLCTVSPSPLSPSRITIHPLPTYKPADPSSTADLKTTISLPGDVAVLISAMRSRRSLSDVVHRLSLPSTPLQEVEHQLLRTLIQLEEHDDGLRNLWLHDFFGLLVETYRSRALRSQNDADKEMLLVRSKVAHDLCSIMACHRAFEDCKDGENSDLDAVWPLSRLCTWLMAFLENVMKECILLGDAGDIPTTPLHTPISHGEDMLATATAPIPPIFIHLLHPGLLSKLRTSVADVRRFHDYLGKLNASGENAQLAKTILMDTVDSSGIDLKGLETVLSQISEETKGLEDDTRSSLAACQPLLSLLAPLRKIVFKLSNAGVIDKPRLFIKASDLVTGIAKLRLLDENDHDEALDVVSKGPLPARRAVRVCLRCRGKVQIRDGAETTQVSPRWTAWESKWVDRCICGGMWAAPDAR